MSMISIGRPGSFGSAVLRAGLHVMGLALLIVIVARALADRAGNRAAIVAVAAVLATLYLAGLVFDARHGSPLRRRLWLACITLVWIALLVLTADAAWLAFPLFLLQLLVLPARWAVPAVAGTTAFTVTGFAAHQGSVTLSALIGPVIGALVAVVGVLGYQALARESERRQELIVQLRAVQAELAEAGHAAGIAAERERLAREIHDTLAQGLSSIQLLLRAVQRDLAAHTIPPETADHIEAARRTAQENLEEARRFVRALSPPDLEHGSLEAALRKLCATTSEAAPVTVRFRVSGEPAEVGTPREVALFRIAQSALTNTVQHARADRATVTLSHLDSGVALDIVDDGVGFDPDAVRRDAREQGRYGLEAMKARAAALGGTLNIESAPGQGTAIAALFTHPVPAGDDSPMTGFEDGS